MSAEPADDGTRFSQVYLRRGEPTVDSARMRRRIAALIHELSDFLGGLAKEVVRIQGVGVPVGYNAYHWVDFLEDAELRDVLDLVSTGAYVLRDKPAQRRWIISIRRILAEENVPYRVNDYGAVRYAVDDEFDANRQATVSALTGARYKAALTSFEAGHSALSTVPPRGRDAIRSVFDAIEGLFRLMFQKAQRIGGDEINEYLAPLVAKLAANPAAAGASSKLLRSFKEWVDAAHFYRHAAGQAEPTEPSLQIATLLVSSGASWLRWLAEIDTAAPANSQTTTAQRA